MKKALTLMAIGVFMLAALAAAADMAELPRSYDGREVDVLGLYENPAAYQQYTADPDGVAAVIVAEDLAKTHSLNAVTAVVFDFRGYDTMGEAFILVTAISGAMAILRGKRKEASVDEQAQD